MRSACAIGFGLAVLLAGGVARAQQDKPQNKPTPINHSSQCSQAQGVGKFQALDTNKDGKISPAEFKGSQKVFAWIDADHDGFVTRPEGTRGYLAIIGGLSLAQKAHAYKAMDTNKDGKLSQTEYKGPKSRFARIDANHDGSITRDEAGRALQVSVRRAMIVVGLKAMDTNKDGSIAASEYKGPKPGFARLDVNKDGRIATNELVTVFQLPMTRHQNQAARTAPTPRPVKPVSTAKATKASRPAATHSMAWIHKVRELDANKDGKIAKAEYLKASDARFTRMDRDKDGSITKSDVIKIVTALKAKAKDHPTAKPVAAPKVTASKPAAVKTATPPTAARPTPSVPVALRMYQGLDANKDGKLYKAELVKGIESWFDRIDSNHDLSLTRPEVQAVLAKRHSH